jgi:MYXO-CTERM domain-containing protein
MAPNDDGSTGNIGLGFDFCFYRESRNSLFINNNGNVTFGASFGGFTPTGFPLTGRAMIAPFWADVDTRNRTDADTNLVWHRTYGSAGNQVFVVTWDSVGYFSGQNGARNTFQLALAENPNQWGTNLNIAFSYGRMDWTTGQASGGGPFGGVPATVGANQGDGVRFSQLGRFGQAGNAYDGAFGNTDGVDFLEYRTFFFNGCDGDVPAPGVLALVGLGGLAAARRRR